MSKLFTLEPDVAREIAARRRPKRRFCDRCSGPFETIGRGRYCSSRCKALAAYARWKQKAERNGQ